MQWNLRNLTSKKPKTCSFPALGDLKGGEWMDGVEWECERCDYETFQKKTAHECSRFRSQFLTALKFSARDTGHANPQHTTGEILVQAGQRQWRRATRIFEVFEFSIYGGAVTHSYGGRVGTVCGRGSSRDAVRTTRFQPIFPKNVLKNLPNQFCKLASNPKIRSDSKFKKLRGRCAHDWRARVCVW